ncbi:hypothetical protein [Alicyclobacillus fodiniaquatilis]|uniref:Uncharacterized protein n=1 Tax=Alicyclobacillus fodiniaquatilis TaxID=1661150 RepID=A0ABW4JJ83_9BACL
MSKSARILESLQAKIIEEVQERIEKRKWNEAIEQQYSTTVDFLYRRFQRLLQPVMVKLEGFDEKDVVLEVFNVKQEGTQLEITLMGNEMVVHPAGHEQNKEEPWTLYVNSNNKTIERLFIARDEEGFYWQILRGNYAERVLDEHIWELIEKGLMEAN